MTPVPVPDDCPHSWKHGQADVTCLLCGASKGDHRLPVPVVNEYEGVQSDVEKIARQLHAQHQDEPVWDKLDGHKRDDYHLFAARVLQCPSVAAAFEAQAQLQNAPSNAKDLELAEAQAKLEAAVGLLKEARQAYEGHGVGDPAVCDDCAFVARIDALLASVEEGGES